ncbi:MAG: hypothetical protein QOH21_2850 [Acidobacteriota bacterium]|jgi:hypothetical protein|nr:hypothetical protein [Acidobacteriota bacterium]
MTRRYAAIGVLLLLTLASTPLAAQTTAGDLIWQPGEAVPSGPLTYIDFTRPVTMDGTVTDVTLRWISNAQCSDQIKFRFFRPGAGGPLGALELVGTAGPFTSANPAPPGVFPDNNVIRLSFPAITVKRGDVLAVTQMKPGCGGAGVVTGRPDDILYETSADFNGGALSASNTIVRTGFRLNAAAHTGAFRQVGVIPAAGSAPGAFGSFFRTEVTITNPSPFGMGVALVFHPAGRSAEPGDARRNTLLVGNESRTYTDIVATLGQTGLGSIDVLTTGFTPVITTRVYDDGGSAGTSGFTEEVVTSYEAIQSGAYADFTIPADLTNYRVNVGIRTLGESTTFLVTVYTATGALVGKTTERTVPANYFEQIPLSAFLAGVTPSAGGLARIQITSGGSATFYTATTDNRTNDGSLKMLTMR